MTWNVNLDQQDWAEDPSEEISPEAENLFTKQRI